MQRYTLYLCSTNSSFLHDAFNRQIFCKFNVCACFCTDFPTKDHFSCNFVCTAYLFNLLCKRNKEECVPELHVMYLKSLYIGVIATCDRTVLLLKHPEREKRHSDNRGQNPLRPFRQIHHFKDFPLTFNCDTPLARKPPPPRSMLFLYVSLYSRHVQD